MVLFLLGRRVFFLALFQKRKNAGEKAKVEEGAQEMSFLGGVFNGCP